MRVRHAHEQLGVAVVEDGVGPVLAHLGVQLADRLAVAVDEHAGAAGLGEQVLDALVEHGLGLVDVQHQGRLDVAAAGVDPADKGLDHGDDHLAGGVGGPLGQERAQLHHQDDALALLEPLDEAVLVGLADDPADIARGQLGERHPQRAGHLGVVVRRGGEDLLHVPGELFGLRGVDVVDLFLQPLQFLVADVVLDVVEVERGGFPGLCGQQDEGLDHHQADLVGHAEEVGLAADGHPGGDVGDQFLGHIVGGERVEDGAVLGEDRGDEHQVGEPVGLLGQLGDLGEQADVALGVDGHHRVALADVLLEDVLHDPGLAHPGGAEAPAVALAGAVGKAQFEDRLGMIEVDAGADVGPGLGPAVVTA